MKLLSMFLAAFLCIAPLGLNALPISASSSSESDLPTELIGDFILLGEGDHNSIVLSNNVYYRPTRKKEVKLLLDWTLGDNIRLFTCSDNGRYVLLNMETGQSIKAKVYSWK